MLPNLSASIIFIARVEMRFHEKYKLYSEAVIGGKGDDIENAKKRMFRQLSSELMTLARLQFMISVVIYLICVIFLPQEGFSGMTMKIYTVPCSWIFYSVPYVCGNHFSVLFR